MSDSGHPSRHGYVQCGWCATWIRPETACEDVPCADRPLACMDRQWCARQMGAAVGGWDANGAPTGIDENGDAA